MLFAFYNDAGDEELVVSVGKTVTLLYHQAGGDDGAKNAPLLIDFGVRISDGKSVPLSFPSSLCSPFLSVERVPDGLR